MNLRQTFELRHTRMYQTVFVFSFDIESDGSTSESWVHVSDKELAQIKVYLVLCENWGVDSLDSSRSGSRGGAIGTIAPPKNLRK